MLVHGERNLLADGVRGEAALLQPLERLRVDGARHRTGARRCLCGSTAAAVPPAAAAASSARGETAAFVTRPPPLCPLLPLLLLPAVSFFLMAEK